MVSQAPPPVSLAVDLTPFVEEGENLLLVVVSDDGAPDVPRPPGGGPLGIWAPAWLEVSEAQLSPSPFEMLLVPISKGTNKTTPHHGWLGEEGGIKNDDRQEEDYSKK